MTIPKQTSPRMADPVLQELWLVKRQLNEAASFEVKQLLASAQKAAQAFAALQLDQSAVLRQDH
jgi:hypothetical protein